MLKNIDKGNTLVVLSLKAFEDITRLDEELANAAYREMYHPTADKG